MYVRDARIQQTFYEDVLGFETTVAHPTGVRVLMRIISGGDVVTEIRDGQLRASTSASVDAQSFPCASSQGKGVVCRHCG